MNLFAFKFHNLWGSRLNLRQKLDQGLLIAILGCKLYVRQTFWTPFDFRNTLSFEILLQVWHSHIPQKFPPLSSFLRIVWVCCENRCRHCCCCPRWMPIQFQQRPGRLSCCPPASTDKEQSAGRVAMTGQTNTAEGGNTAAAFQKDTSGATTTIRLTQGWKTTNKQTKNRV